nr:MAG TPA: hypothetical protein [Caudoviricetes sp.]
MRSEREQRKTPYEKGLNTGVLMGLCYSLLTLRI